MARHTRLACVIALLAMTSAEKAQTRWSRQISSYTSDISDWVPLPGPVEREPLPPIKRQAVAEPRILSEPVFPGFSRPTGFSQDFPSRTFINSGLNRQLYLQSMPAVPSAPQNYLNDQGFGQVRSDGGFGQSIRFGLSQPNFPLNQGFVGPQFPFDPTFQLKPRPSVASNPIKFEDYQKTNLSPSSQAKPFGNQAPKKAEPPKFVDGYRAENVSSFGAVNRKPQSLQKLKYETASFDKVPKTEMLPPNKPKEREEVQLLYVPLESLNRGQFGFRSPLNSAQLLNTDQYSQTLQKQSIPRQNYGTEFQRPAKPVESYANDQDFFSKFNTQFKDLDQIPKFKELDQVPKFSTSTSPFSTSPPITPKLKKLKPHQPPLAIFMNQESKKGSQVKVGDVLSTLKHAETVSVLDSVNPQTAPKVFIGPSNLSPPENYVKFELPYLSNIEHSDKKLRQLPFFVAPLSYNTPQGFAKIPFPSPHVGSVVINSQIKETTTSPTTSDVMPNSYSTSPQTYKPISYSTAPQTYQQNTYTTSPQTYQQNTYSTSPQTYQPNRHTTSSQNYKPEKPATPTPSFSFYTTASPPTSAPINHQSNYYSFEPQTVSTIRPPKEPQASINPPAKPGSYFLSNVEPYNPSHVSFRDDYRTQEPVKAFNIATTKQTETTSTHSTTTMTTPKPSTYPNQLLETHNPYSINQAFHFSTPLDYHNFFDENYGTPGNKPVQPSLPSSPSPTPSSSPSPSPASEVATEKQKYQSSPNYLQNYTPEIHYESEVQNSRYPVYDTENYSKTEVSSEYNPSVSSIGPDNSHALSSVNPPTEYNGNIGSQSSQNENTEQVNKVSSTLTDSDTLSTRSPYLYNQYDTSYEPQDKQSSSTSTTSTTTTTTTTRRTPLRGRVRPRYTTPRPDSSESTSRTVVTRKPLRERRPLPTRPKYEPNKITTERATRKPVDSNESTTKYSRGRTRGRVHFKPSESDDFYSKPNKGHFGKDEDLAYQRDVLHQNYPVTLMERTSTVDIEAITEPIPKISSTRNLDSTTEVYDTENAYSNDKASIAQHISNTASREESTKSETQTETPYAPKLLSTHEDFSYQSRSSLAPVDAISYDETSGRDEDYSKQTTPAESPEKPEVVSYETEPSSVITEDNSSILSINNFFSAKQEETATSADIELSKVASNEAGNDEEPEEYVVQTTPSYNRVRVRPGVIRQYHQAASTESSRTKSERRRPIQAITYRPAFDRRRTTMRIEEIEADLKTKQVHTRTEEHRHPVYKPEPTTEPPVTSSYSQETTTKRGVFRRRRPSYTTTTSSPDIPSSRRGPYELKGRFRGRRPTEKPTEKPETSTESTTATPRNALYSRYSNRPKLSERYNKKPEQEETEDQDSNYSINSPKYLEPESEQWSPKISTDSFKPYNPNDIVDDKKLATTERKTNDDDQDIITAKNEYDDILISVTPATNNRANKKIPDIPPTLEALVEQSKIANTDSGDSMSTFETMLEEVMKSLEEQDEDEYTSKVMKHKGGEIGEIPPERVISSGDNYYSKSTTVEDKDITTVEPIVEDSSAATKVRH